jgi:DNA polymerase-1
VTTDTFFYDTETYPIRPGLLAPKLVCLQSAKNKTPVKIELAQDCLSTLESTLSSDCLLVAHNGAYDQVVTAREFPHLLPMWFKALGEGRGRDTMIKERLIYIANGSLQDRLAPGTFALDGLVKRYLGVGMDKGEDSWRLRYALLADTPVANWPSAAYKYAHDDVALLRGVYEKQLEEDTPDEWFHVAAAFVLQLATVWGMKTDPVTVSWVETALLTSQEAAQNMLIDAGLFSDGSVKQDRVQAAVEAAFKSAGKEPPRTNPTARNPQGQIKTDADTITTALRESKISTPEIEGLRAKEEHSFATKMLSTYIQPLKAPVMNCGYNVVVATGRTSSFGSSIEPYNPWWPEETPRQPRVSFGTSAQTWPQAEGIRDCVVARPGTFICSVDYNSLELRTLGQVCLWLLGRSTFADGYRSDPDWDPHTYMGGLMSGLTYDQAMSLKGTAKVEFKNGPRKIAKNINFGYAGGLGPKRFSEMSVAAFESGMLPAPIEITEAYKYRDLYLSGYPEMVEYFEVADYHAKSGEPVLHPVSNRRRAGCTFTSAANTRFQGLAADIAKRAMFLVSQACYCEPESPLYGSRPLAFIHDEIVLEVVQDRAHEAAMEVVRLMEAAATAISPDVPYRAEPALATRWIKAMSPKFIEGKLVPYDL